MGRNRSLNSENSVWKDKIPDWISSICSVFAAIGLVWTLLLQKQATDAQVLATNNQIIVNKAQLEADNRDYDRYVNEIKPLINFQIMISHGTGMLSYTVNNNAAYDFWMEANDREYVFLQDLAPPMNVNLNAKPFNILYSLNEKKTKQTYKNLSDFAFAFKIHFKDRIGHAYTQQFICFIYKNDQVISQSPILDDHL